MSLALAFLLLVATDPATEAVSMPAPSPCQAAEAALAAGDVAASLDAFEQALAASPNDLRCGSEYRRAVIAAGAYDRAIDYWKQLVAAHPEAGNAELNLGYAYVDKIPVEGAITQVLLANTALGHFSRAIELEETWLGRFTRGNSYLYWPPIFGRTAKGIEDLERAMVLAADTKPLKVHARAWAALGDAHWRLSDLPKAREIWREGALKFPDDPGLAARLAKNDEELATYLEAIFDPGVRVDTDLRALFEE